MPQRAEDVSKLAPAQVWLGDGEEGAALLVFLDPHTHGGRYQHPHFTDEGTCSGGQSHFPTILGLGSGKWPQKGLPRGTEPLPVPLPKSKPSDPHSESRKRKEPRADLFFLR